MLYLLVLLIGLLSGYLFGYFYINMKIIKRTGHGFLKVLIDSDEPYLFLELSNDEMNNIMNKDKIELKIERVSQK